MTPPPPDNEVIDTSESLLHHCFDVDYIYDNCVEIWININVHFFLDDVENGTIHPDPNIDLDQSEAFRVAEAMINDANDQFINDDVLKNGDIGRKQWNQAPWGITTATENPCMPFRYLLSGVYIHHSDDNTIANLKNTGVLGPQEINQLNNTYGVNTDAEFNMYFIKVRGGASGQANGIPGNTMIMEIIDDRGLFNHEMGHAFGLFHSHIPDRVGDTPEINYSEYDFNCDGDTDDNFPGGVGPERTSFNHRQCWVAGGDFEGTIIDYRGDGVDIITEPCNRDITICEQHPCCDWKFGNNNIMSTTSYSKCCGVFTEGQVKRILHQFNNDSNNLCDKVESVGSQCPPPSAVIGLLPRYAESEGTCTYCINLEASMNEAYYEIIVTDITPGATNGTIVTNTGWLQGEVRNFCISRNKFYDWMEGYEPDHTYEIQLSVENVCGDEVSSDFTFILPSEGCDYGGVDPIDPTDILVIDINPSVKSTGLINIDYELFEAGTVTVYVSHIYNGLYATPIESTMVKPAGQYSNTVDISQWHNGLHFIIVQYENMIITDQFIKSE